jgi:hypothetical protein
MITQQEADQWLVAFKSFKDHFTNDDNLEEKLVERLEECINSRHRSVSAFDWYGPPQGQKFWMSYYLGENQEKGVEELQKVIDFFSIDDSKLEDFL